MEKEKCSNCGLNGHDSGMCKERDCFKLFGVNILDHKSTKRSVSMGNLQSQCSESNYHQLHIGYHSESEGQVSTKRGRMENGRQKPKPWTEEEHQKFLQGLKTIGKGKWTRISESYVPTKTPIQVASHAQKFFLRQASSDKKKKRSSIFDKPSEEFALDSLQDSPLAKNSMNKTSYQASSPSSVMPLEQPLEIPAQATTSSQIVNGFSHSHSNSFITPIPPNHGIPNCLAIPCLLPVLHHGNGNSRNFAILATPVTVHPSGIPATAPETFPPTVFVADSHTKISIEERTSKPLDWQ